MVKDHTIKIKNLTIYYRTAGDSKDPPVVLLNGWGARLTKLPFLGNHLNSAAAIGEFARRGFYVYSPEHPGLMRSETPETVWGPKDYADYLKEFVEKLDIKDFVLVGQSFGGAIVTFYAAEYPERIKKLVLVGSGLSHDKKFRFVFKRRKYFSGLLRSLLVPDLLKKVVVSLSQGVPWKWVEKEGYEERAIMWIIFSNWSLPNVYAKIQVPTLLIWGTRDRLFPLSSAREVAKEIPNASLFTISGGHSVLYTKPKEVVGLIISKLSQKLDV